MNVSSPPTPIDASNGIGIRPHRLIVAPHVALMPWCGSDKDAAARHVAKTFFFFKSPQNCYFAYSDLLSFDYLQL